MDTLITELLAARRKDAEATSVTSVRSSQVSQTSSCGSSEVAALVCRISPDDIESILATAAQSESVSFLDILSTLFRGASDTQARGQKQRFNLCASVVELVDSGAIQSSKEAAAAVQRVMTELDTLSFKEVANLVEAILGGLKVYPENPNTSAPYDGSCLALLPKLLMRITQGSFVDDNKAHVTGADFKVTVLEQLNSLDWPANIAVHIVTVLREIPMPKATVLQLSEKALKLIKKLAVQDLPAYVYQSLLFASTKQAKVCDCNARCKLPCNYHRYA